MATFAQKRRAFEDAQAYLKANPDDKAAKKAFEAARQAIIDSPEVEKARRGCKGSRVSLSPWR